MGSNYLSPPFIPRTCRIKWQLWTIDFYLYATSFQTFTSHLHLPSNPDCSWYQVMMTSSNGNIFRVTGNLCGKFTDPRWIPRTKASDAELDVFFDLRLNKRLSKQSWGWWFETLSRPFWRHRNGKPRLIPSLHLQKHAMIFRGLRAVQYKDLTLSV